MAEPGAGDSGSGAGEGSTFPVPPGPQRIIDSATQKALERLEAFWAEALPLNDVARFIEQQSGAPPGSRILLLQDDQMQRFRAGLRIAAENYLEIIGRWRDTPARTGWDFVFTELLLRKRAGEGASKLQPEFMARFPQFQSDLQEQFDAFENDETEGLETRLVPASELTHDDAHRDTVFRSTINSAESPGADPPSRELPLDMVLTTLDMEDDSADGSSLALSEGSFHHAPDSVLGRCHPFIKLPPALVRRIEQRMTSVRFAPGDYLMRQGERGDGLFLLTSGRVRIQAVDACGTLRDIAESGTGEILGEMALLTEEPRTAHVVAVEPATARFLPAPVFDELAAEFPVIGRALTQLLAERLGRAGHDALAGKTLNGYRIEQRLGRGGMAIVYRAVSEATRERVALKMMSHRLVYDAEALKLFQREASIIESFDHPNIVGMRGRFRAFRSFFIVMEYCDGCGLDALVHDHTPLTEPVLRAVVAQLAGALGYAHSRQVVHRDVKPSNILMTRTGMVKLMDFGLANPIDQLASGMIVGTPRYMAPEQLAGKALDTRADLFSFGLTIYRLATGRDYIPERKLGDIQRRHRDWTIPPVSDFPADVGALVTQCLQPDPARRKVDLQEVAAWTTEPLGRHLPGLSAFRPAAQP